MTTKLRVLNPRKLIPPKDVQDRIKQKEIKLKMKNPIFRFFALFFGEGF